MLRRFARRLGFAALTATLAFGALEAVLWLWYGEEGLLYRYERRESMVRMDNGIFVPQPSSDLTNNDGPYTWTAHYNARGFRETEETPDEPPAGKRRFLALGDSRIFGFSVTQGRTIADQVEARAPEFDIVNAGVFGSSAYDMLRRWNEWGSKLNVEGLILGMPHNANRQLDAAAERALFYQSPAAPAAIHLKTYLWMRLLLVPLRTPKYAQPNPQLSPDVADILTIARDARDHGLPVFFLLFPVRYEGGGPGVEWQQTLGPQGVIFAGHALTERSCWGHEDLGHPSEAGADAIAGTLIAVLQGGPSQNALVADPPCAP